jgi:hypothetical protein
MELEDRGTRLYSVPLSDNRDQLLVAVNHDNEYTSFETVSKYLQSATLLAPSLLCCPQDVKPLYQHFNTRLLGRDLQANIETFSEGWLAVLTS